MAEDAKAAEDLLKKLRRLRENTTCPNCGTSAPNGIGFANICIKFKTFVCDLCKTSHQAISHRVKSVTMSTWTMEEVQCLTRQRMGGNAVARHIWLSNAPNYGCKYRGGVRPKAGDQIEHFKQFVIDCYESGMFKATTPFVDPGDDESDFYHSEASFGLDVPRKGKASGIAPSPSRSTSKQSIPRTTSANQSATPAAAAAAEIDLLSTVFSSTEPDFFRGFTSAPTSTTFTNFPTDTRIPAQTAWPTDPFAQSTAAQFSAGSAVSAVDPFGLGGLTLTPTVATAGAAQPVMRNMGMIPLQGNAISCMPVSPKHGVMGMGGTGMGGIGARPPPMQQLMGMYPQSMQPTMQPQIQPMRQPMTQPMMQPMMQQQPIGGYLPQQSSGPAFQSSAMQPNRMPMSNTGFAIGAMPVMLNQTARGSSSTSSAQKSSDSFDFVSQLMK